jgi:hypothetical protein
MRRRIKRRRAVGVLQELSLGDRVVAVAEGGLDMEGECGS